MPHMSKTGLFVLHEGVGSTIFTSQVLEHALSMDRVGVRFTILTFETFQKARKISEKNLQLIPDKYKSVKVILKLGMNIYLPFSTFSAEVALHLVEGRLAWSMTTVATHVLGSLAMTLLGIWTVSLVRAWHILES